MREVRTQTESREADTALQALIAPQVSNLPAVILVKHHRLALPKSAVVAALIYIAAAFPAAEITVRISQGVATLVNQQTISVSAPVTVEAPSYVQTIKSVSGITLTITK